MRFFIVIFGPTASGKTDYALELARDLPVEIINADVGQFYAELSIGTAKPDWQQEPTPHHMFDVVSGPKDYSAFQYQRACLSSMEAIWDRGNIPMIVGGSGFYIKSLFFPPRVEAVQAEKAKKELLRENKKSELVQHDSKLLWERLYEIDPMRAKTLHPHDKYRIERALALWEATGVLPSHLKPEFQVPASCLFLYLDRDRDELAERINKRVDIMMDQGWLQEVQELYKNNPAWCEFLERKGLMGYGDICKYIREITQENLVDTIKQKTREYSRRQRIFWRSLKKELQESPLIESREILLPEINSEFAEIREYIRQRACKVD